MGFNPLVLNKTNIDKISRIHYFEYAGKNNEEGLRTDCDLTLYNREKNLDFLFQQHRDLFYTLGEYNLTQNDTIKDHVSRLFKVHRNNILITSGCDGALEIVSNLLVNNSVNVAVTLPSFGRYEFFTKRFDGNLNYIKFCDFPCNIKIERLVNSLSKKKIDVLYLANPNNPTGQYLSEDKIIYLLDNFEGILILDESLFLDLNKSVAHLVSKYPNLIIVNSFSKTLGIPGARIGFIIANENYIYPLDKLISPFAVSSDSLRITELLLNNPTYLEENINQIKSNIALIKEDLKDSADLRISDTETLMALIVLDESKPYNLHDFLIKNGIKTVNGKSFRGLSRSNTVRITLVDRKRLNYFIKFLRKCNMIL